MLAPNCPDPLKGSVSVHRWTGSALAETWHTRTDYNDPATSQARVTLLGEPPVGWLLAEDTLQAFEDGTEYVAGSGRPGQSVTFTPEQVRELGPGQVMVGDLRAAHKIIPEAEFQQGTAKHCY
ncbi:MAG TPA: hypothetical protein VN408_31430 [Actinoplanes sp.]|nr:hypothetical protein [Actinoplanes sp.]